MTRHKSTWITFFAPVAVAIVLLALGGDAAREALRYERLQMLPWRLVGAHLVHLSWSHLALNLAGLVMIGVIFSFRVTATFWWLCFALALACIDVGLFRFSADIEWYVGLSGVLHGLFVLGAFAEWQQGQKTGIYLLLGVAAKLGVEQWAGALPMTASAAGGPVVVDAHLYGALGGLIACGLMRAFSRSRPAGDGESQ
ncbi:MAG: rhombosortase [Pseudomonadota bacterium]